MNCNPPRFALLPPTACSVLLLGTLLWVGCGDADRHPQQSAGAPSLDGLCTDGVVASETVGRVSPNDWFVLAGMFVHTRDANICSDWARLRDAGFSPKIGWSDELPSFRPGWIVLVEGPLRTDSARARALEMRAFVPESHAWPGW